MRMPVMQVRQVRMAVRKGLVLVRVSMRLGPFVAAVRMLMVRIVRMQVFVPKGFMPMRVRVLLGEREPGGRKHQQECGDEAGGHRLAQQCDRERGADERRGGKMRRGARAAEVAQGDDV
jgi:hypothetical protein